MAKTSECGSFSLEPLVTLLAHAARPGREGGVNQWIASEQGADLLRVPDAVPEGVFGLAAVAQAVNRSRRERIDISRQVKTTYSLARDRAEKPIPGAAVPLF